MDVARSDIDRLEGKLRRAIEVIRKLEDSAGAQAPRSGAGPIAIISMACRFPGAPSLEAFAGLLWEGRDGVSEIPADRLAPAPGAEPASFTSRAAGILEGSDLFDSRFFGFNAREADALDPQHRLLLETCHEALERAAIAPASLAGHRTGVFIGMSNNDYGQLKLRAGDHNAIHAYDFTGNIMATAAGAISYVFDFTGPCLVLDTACSSSLVAVCEAVEALRGGRADMALAGGVNLILHADMQAALSRLGALSPTGRCRTFDVAADGYVRGEGVGIVALKRLADAERDGDPILAVIRGAALNHDGRSNGMFAPNGMAQRAVLTAALADAGLTPDDLCCIETHGTGTALGDPIEVDAIRAVFDQRGSGLPLGAVKSAVGHLEAAAGVAGLIKLVLALNRRSLPGNLHFNAPNPHIGWGNHLRPADRHTPLLPNAQGRFCGGVSSFGVSGSNAHVVVEALPQRGVSPGGLAELILVSASDGKALTATAMAHAHHFTGASGQSLQDAAFTLLKGRDLRNHRIAVAARTTSEAAEALKAAVSVPLPENGSAVAFLCSGQGSHVPGMGASLYAAEPAFRAVLDRADAALRRAGGFALLDEVILAGEAGYGRLADTRYAQPALFALGVGLAALYRGWGVEPVALIGHSLGEYVAASIAGVFSLEDGMRLVAARARFMADAPGQGGMLACQAGADALRTLLPAGVEIAAINGPTSVTLSGPVEALAALKSSLAGLRIRSAALPVSHAFHSAMMEPAAAQLRSVLRSIRLSPPGLPVISNLTGQVAGEALCDPEYWCAQLRQPVLFQAGVGTLTGMNAPLWIELGARPVLSASAAETAEARGAPRRILPSLVPGIDERHAMLNALAQWVTAGGTPNADGLFAGRQPRRAELPTYVFSKRRHWVQAPPRTAVLPGTRTDLHDGSVLFEAMLDDRALPWAADHQVFGAVLFPASGFLDLVLQAARAALGTVPQIERATIRNPLRLDHPVATRVHTRLTQLRPGVWQAAVSSRAGAGEVIEHATAQLNLRALEAAGLPDEPDWPVTEPASAFTARALAVGISYGPAFNGMRQVRFSADGLGARAHVSIAAEMAGGSVCHPALLDACFQVAGAALTRIRPGTAFVPVAAQAVSCVAPGMDAVDVMARIASGPGQSLLVDLDARDGAGALAFTVRGLRLEPVTADSLQHLLPARWRDWLYDIAWEPLPLGADPLPGLAGLALRSGRRLEKVAVTLDGRATADLETYCLGLVELALAELDPQWSSLEAMLAGVVPAQRPLFHRLLRIASDAGLMTRDGPGYGNVKLRAVAEIGRALAVMDRGNIDPAQLALAERCGRNLAGVLRGETHPLAVLFPDGDDRLVREVYTGSPVFVSMQHEVTRIFEALAEPAAPRQLRVLEVGAGTGATSAGALQALHGKCQRYVFTDVSQLLLDRARQRFAQHDFVAYQLFDAETGGAEDLGEAGFDIILAANVVHATRDLGQTLGNLRRLLRPGGMLVLVEGVTRWIWADITFGMTDGWWRFRDHQLRPDHPLLGEAGWSATLAAAGFGEVHALAPRGASGASLSGQAIIMASSAVAREGGAALAHVIGGPPQLRAALAAGLGGQGWTAASQIEGSDLVIDLGWLEAVADPDAHLARCLETLQRCARSAPRHGVCFVTAGACSDAASVWQSALWGMVRAANREKPETAARCLDLEPRLDHEAMAGGVLKAMMAPRDLCRLRGGAAEAPHLVPFTALPPPLADGWLPGGTVLITGAFGGLGQLLISHLASRAVRRLVLVARNQPDAAARSVIARAEAAGTGVVLLTGDIGDSAIAARAVALADDKQAPLLGVIHAAGAVADGLLASQTSETLRTVLAPKAHGALALHEALGRRKLSFFLLFSSITSLLGVAGQANHAAASVMLDALALNRRASGLTATSVIWGPWSDAGAATRGGIGQRIQAMGVGAIRPRDGLTILDHLMNGSGSPARIAVMPVDWPVFTARYGDDPLFPMARPQAPILTAAPAPVTASGLADRLARTAPGQRGQAAIAAVSDLVRMVLGLGPEEAVKPDQGLFEAGLDSLTAMELRNLMSKAAGQILPATLVFSHPTIADLAALVLNTLNLAEAAPSQEIAPQAMAPDIAALDHAALAAMVEREMLKLGIA